MKPVSNLPSKKVPESFFLHNKNKLNSSLSEVIITKAGLHCKNFILFYHIIHLHAFFGGAQDSLSVMKTGMRRSCGHSFCGSRAVCTRAVPKAW